MQSRIQVRGCYWKTQCWCCWESSTWFRVVHWGFYWLPASTWCITCLWCRCRLWTGIQTFTRNFCATGHFEKSKEQLYMRAYGSVSIILLAFTNTCIYTYVIIYDGWHLGVYLTFLIIQSTKISLFCWESTLQMHSFGYQLTQ